MRVYSAARAHFFGGFLQEIVDTLDIQELDLMLNEILDRL
jgi:hypothetical protein